MGADTEATQVFRIVAERGLVRSRDLTERGIARATLMRLVRAGRLKQIARGLYALPDQPLSRQHLLAEVAARSSRGVLCLLTALHFHGMLQKAPEAVWLAIPNRGRAPKGDAPPLHIVRFSGGALTEGVEHYVIDGVVVRVYSVAKTVADCFKFRRIIGLDAAVDALRMAVRDERAGPNELEHYARVCRVSEVMRPHLDAAVRGLGTRSG